MKFSLVQKKKSHLLTIRSERMLNALALVNDVLYVQISKFKILKGRDGSRSLLLVPKPDLADQTPKMKPIKFSNV